MIRGLLLSLGIAGCVAVLLMTTVGLVAPQRDGLVAVSLILAPYPFLMLLVFLPLCFAHGTRARLLRRLMAVCAIVFLVRFMPGTVSVARAPDPGALQVPVASWNLELGRADPSIVVAAIRQMSAGVVALEELTPGHAAAIGADPAIAITFPYQVLRPRGGSDGLGLLSSWPIDPDWTFSYAPPILDARISPADGQAIAVVVAHPYRGTFPPGILGVPTYDARDRDAAIGDIRRVIDPILAAGTPLILVGDFNTVDREVGYADLAAGLTDAQHAVGLGPGLTWRPGDIEWLPFGLLRIDAVFSANGLVPLSVGPDCTPRGSDHCILHALLELPGG